MTQHIETNSHKYLGIGKRCVFHYFEEMSAKGQMLFAKLLHGPDDQLPIARSCWCDIHGTNTEHHTQLVALLFAVLLRQTLLSAFLQSNFTYLKCSENLIHSVTLLPNVPKVEASWGQSSFKFATASDWNILQKSLKLVNFYHCIFSQGHYSCSCNLLYYLLPLIFNVHSGTLTPVLLFID